MHEVFLQSIDTLFIDGTLSTNWVGRSMSTLSSFIKSCIQSI